MLQVSPDRRYVFFIARRGDLSCDCNEYVLYVFSSEQLAARLKSKSSFPRTVDPIHRLVFRSGRSAMNEQPITLARWEGSRHLAFLGIQNNGPRRVYRLDVESGALTALTSPDEDVVQFSSRGEFLIYGVLTETSRVRAQNRYPAFRVTVDDWSTSKTRTITYFARSNGSAPWRIAARSGFRVSGTVAQPQISPDGHWAVVIGALDETPIPEEWRRYRWSRALPQHIPIRFLLVDLRHRTVEPMLNAPVGDVTRDGSSYEFWPRSEWLSDSRRIVLVNTALPFATRDQPDVDEEREKQGYVVVYDVRSRRWSILEPRFGGMGSARTRISAVKLRGSTRSEIEIERTLATFPTSPAEGSVYTYSPASDRWMRHSMSPLAIPKLKELDAGTVRLADGVSVFARESANDPPQIFASNGSAELSLTGPDSALDGIWRATVQTITWREQDGKESRGGLMLPRDFVRGHPVPLVIEAYSWSPKYFRPSGHAHSVYGGQALVANGIAVLALNIPAVDTDWQTKIGPIEGEAFVNRLDAAVQRLAKDGYVDPTRVGLMGFSRSGMNVFHAITNPQHVDFAAAVVGDTAAYAIGQYIHWGATTDTERNLDDLRAWDEEIFMGGSLWGKGRSTWLKRDPMLNANRGRAALLVAEANSDPWQARLWLGAFRLNRRPLEYLLLPEAAHQYQRPREQEAATEAGVDWMNFWLTGHENTTPDEVERNSRWRQMRELNDSRMTNMQSDGSGASSTSAEGLED